MVIAGDVDGDVVLWWHEASNLAWPMPSGCPWCVMIMFWCSFWTHLIDSKIVIFRVQVGSLSLPWIVVLLCSSGFWSMFQCSYRRIINHIKPCQNTVLIRMYDDHTLMMMYSRVKKLLQKGLLWAVDFCLFGWWISKILPRHYLGIDTHNSFACIPWDVCL